MGDDKKKKDGNPFTNIPSTYSVDNTYLKQNNNYKDNVNNGNKNKKH